jgi:hypothetical protein
MKTIKSMLAIKSILAAATLITAASAQAIEYNIIGTLTAWSGWPAPAITTYPSGAPSFWGTVSDTSGAYTFNFADFTTHVYLDAGLDGIYQADLTTSGQKLVGVGNSIVTSTVITQSCLGAAILCNSIPYQTISGSLNINGGSIISGTLNTSQAAHGGPLTATYSFTSLIPEIPIPAAAWLFGSGLLGLAGAKRRRA